VPPYLGAYLGGRGSGLGLYFGLEGGWDSLMISENWGGAGGRHWEWTYGEGERDNVLVSSNRRPHLAEKGFACGRRIFRLRSVEGRSNYLDETSQISFFIRLRLGGSCSLADTFPPRPKGMHRTGYHRLQAKGLAHEEVFLGALRLWLNEVKANG